ncbi:MAG: FmdB family transcriptional regulator [Actinomycetota bacterium]|nr:FmdB family transcriptional regulator [Actinomycetota bacterium]
MPIYEYRCTKGHAFEAFQSMSEDSISECQECGGPCERVLSAPAIHYKGSGFYTTDYARKGANKQTAAESDSSSGGDKSSSDSSGSSKSDSSGSSGSSTADAKPSTSTSSD